MEGIQSQFKSYNAQLDKELSKYTIFNTVEKRTNVPKTYLALGVGAFMFVLIFFDFAGQLLSNLVGWVYPAYRSFKAIETTEKTDDTQWLTYWAVYGFVALVEFFSNLILYWVPFYYLIKTLFFLWLFLPQFKGAQTLYTRFLRPALLQYSGDVDSGIKHIKTTLKAVAHEGVSAALADPKID
ncbi:11818_t:CDS:2 [Paraglomus brasilianum]|uniref:Protein YOP1 n=1 Tax=Paraglomus brasilianum TaxID=144538 RepID=A0A9N8Z756_9GLOM|nr:11818_t:CDS:2 [Paraglomus brasilianum]